MLCLLYTSLHIIYRVAQKQSTTFPATGDNYQIWFLNVLWVLYVYLGIVFIFIIAKVSILEVFDSISKYVFDA